MPVPDWLTQQKQGLAIAKTLPQALKADYMEMGIDHTRFVPAPDEGRPYTAAGSFGVNEYSAPQLVGKNITGLTSRNGETDSKKPYNGATVLYAPDENQRMTRAHEYEHVLADQSLGRGSQINQKFDELVGDGGTTRSEVVDALLKHAPHLVQQWGLPKDVAERGYFSKPMADQYGLPRGMFNEQAATLSALEQAKNKRLVDDPYVRQNILNTPAKREAYDAVTGLRQTRLDARDLPPYTRVAEDKSDTPKPKSEDFVSSVLKFLSRR